MFHRPIWQYFLSGMYDAVHCSINLRWPFMVVMVADSHAAGSVACCLELRRVQVMLVQQFVKLRPVALGDLCRSGDITVGDLQ